MNVGSFVHSIGHGIASAEHHVVHFVEGEAPKVEKLVLEIETWIGANATAKTFFQPIIDALTAGVHTLGGEWVKTLEAGGGVGALVTAVEKDIPTLITKIKDEFVAQAKAADPNHHTSIVIGLVDLAYALIAPKLPALLAGFIL